MSGYVVKGAPFLSGVRCGKELCSWHENSIAVEMVQSGAFFIVV